VIFVSLDVCLCAYQYASAHMSSFHLHLCSHVCLDGVVSLDTYNSQISLHYNVSCKCRLVGVVCFCYLCVVVGISYVYYTHTYIYIYISI
jgi:hypothetical protein